MAARAHDQELLDKPEAAEQGEAQSDYLAAELHDIFTATVQSALQGDLLPRATQISADIAQLQQEAEATTATANAEKAELDGELVRLTSLVATFQASIAQFLPGLSMGGC